MKASSADTEHADKIASDDEPPPRISFELLERRRSDLVFFGLTQLSDCLPVSVAARNLYNPTVNVQHKHIHNYLNARGYFMPS